MSSTPLPPDGAAIVIPKTALSGVSHAIRNSLNAIGLTLTNAVRQLDKEPPSPRRDDLASQLRLALDEGEVARRTIVRFVDLYRAREARLERVGVGELIEGAFSHERVGGGPPPARVPVEVPEGLIARADPRLARQALAEVVANALEAARGAGDGVRVRARAASGAVAIEVEDRGKGFSAATLARCFEPFYTGWAEHLGLGLTIAARFAELQGGSVTAANAPSGGARVALRLPAG